MVKDQGLSKAVVGVPDSISGEKVLAYIIPEGDNDISDIEVLKFCRDRMAAYKIPSKVFSWTISF